MARRIEDSEELKRACAERLRLTRMVLDLPQGKFAARAGIAQNTYNQYEAGKRFPDYVSCIRLCETYGITMDWIFRGVGAGLPYDLLLKLRQHYSFEG